MVPVCKTQQEELLQLAQGQKEAADPCADEECQQIQAVAQGGECIPTVQLFGEVVA
jgi:hypothetical protein